VAQRPAQGRPRKSARGSCRLNLRCPGAFVWRCQHEQRLARLLVRRDRLGRLRVGVAPVPSALRSGGRTAVRVVAEHVAARSQSGHRHHPLSALQRPRRQAEPELHRGQSRQSGQHRLFRRLPHRELPDARAVLVHGASRLSPQCSSRCRGERQRRCRDDWGAFSRFQRAELRRCGLRPGPGVCALARPAGAAPTGARVLRRLAQRSGRLAQRHSQRGRVAGESGRFGVRRASRAAVAANALAFASDLSRHRRAACARGRRTIPTPKTNGRRDLEPLIEKRRWCSGNWCGGGSGRWRVPRRGAARFISSDRCRAGRRVRRLGPPRPT